MSADSLNRPESPDHTSPLPSQVYPKLLRRLEENQVNATNVIPLEFRLAIAELEQLANRLVGQ